MKPTITHYLAALLFCTAAQPLFAEPPSKIQASYDVIGFGMTLAKIEETFTRTDDSYHIESVTKAVGLLATFKPETVRVISTGKMKPQGLLPLIFTLKREVDTDKNAAAKFNWEKSLLTHTDYKGVNDMPLAKDTQDRLSSLYQLQILAKTGQTEFKFGVTDGNNLEDYIYQIAAEEQNIRVPLGVFKTRYIFSTPIGEQMKQEIWMATERDNFPCKIIVTDSKGGKLTQVLTALTITP